MFRRCKREGGTVVADNRRERREGIVLIAAILLTFGHYSADAAILPNADADSLAQCDYSAARLIENPSEEASVFPQDVPACGSFDGGANDETKDVAVVVDVSVDVSAAINP